jgi:YHS domain-containing protein
MIQVFRIDKNGFYIEPVIIQDTEPIPLDCVQLMPPSGLFKPQIVNGSWVEGEDPSVLLQFIKNKKILDLDDKCKSTILGNFAYAVDGTTYYFPNDDTAQKNFDKFEIAFRNGYATTPENFTCYDSSGNVCRVPFDATTFPPLYAAHLMTIANNISTFRDDLELKVNAATTVDELNGIQWYTGGRSFLSSSSNMTVIVD